MPYANASKTDAQFKRIREQVRQHLDRVARHALTALMPPLPPDVWPWGEAVLWQGYTDAQKTTLMETGFTIDIARPTSQYTPFTTAYGFQLTVASNYVASNYSVAVHFPTPFPSTLPVPCLSRENVDRMAKRGSGYYLSTYTLTDVWQCMQAHFDAPETCPVPLPPALLGWLGHRGGVAEVAREYAGATRLIDHVWARLREACRHGARPLLSTPEGAPLSANVYMLTVPEWIPMRLLPANRRRPLSPTTRRKAEAHIEALLQQGDADIVGRLDLQQPLLPQLRQHLLPALTAYRLTGKDTDK